MEYTLNEARQLKDHISGNWSRQPKLEVSRGNKKLGVDTLILNMGTATECSSKALGLCNIYKAGIKCYALKSEVRFPKVYQFRQRQRLQWERYNAVVIAGAIINKYWKLIDSGKIKYLRFSEAGDFMIQDDITKMDKIAGILNDFGVVTYGYTARKDLDYSGVRYMIINGSGFTKAGISNTFTGVKEYGRNEYNKDEVNCRGCKLCKTSYGMNIKVKFH